MPMNQEFLEDIRKMLIEYVGCVFEAIGIYAGSHLLVRKCDAARRTTSGVTFITYSMQDSFMRLHIDILMSSTSTLLFTEL